MAPVEVASLPVLQAQIKRDPGGYEQEFLMQYRHYRAALAMFSLKPSAESKEFCDLVMFMSQVASCYPKDASSFSSDIMTLLDTHGPSLHPSVRRHLVQALILLRSRKVVDPTDLLPLFFRLFRCTDKALRQLLFSHIVHDIRRGNAKHKDDRLNRYLQNFLYGMVQDENETAAKKSLAVLIELHRRQVWTDAKTVNVISSACFHKSTGIMVAALKFFLGSDQNGDGSDTEEEDDDENKKSTQVTLDREAVYKAYNKGTNSSKKKKQAKLQRVLHGLKKQQRAASGGATGQASFAALHLLHDPQGFAEKLFATLRSSNERFEVKLLMMNVISRVIGTHRLLVLNFYPFLQKYVQPHQRDVTQLLATAVQACHDHVPPDAVESLLRQLVNQFVHDRARPEVIAVGLNTVREMCARMPLLMTEELLHDLALYKKSKEKAIVSAARSIIGLFRELAPSLLEKKDRGRGADITATLKAYGEAKDVMESVPGIELLHEASEEEEEEEGDEDQEEDGNDSDEEPKSAEVEKNGILAMSEDGSEGGEDDEGEEDGEEEEEEDDADENDDDEDLEMQEEVEDASEDEGMSGSQLDSEDEIDGQADSGSRLLAAETAAERAGKDETDTAEEGNQESAEISDQIQINGEDKGSGDKQGVEGTAVEGTSLRALKKLAGDKLKPKQVESATTTAGEEDGFLSNEDFQHIRRVQAKRAVETAMARHGLKRGKNGDVQPSVTANLANLSEKRVDPAALEASIKRKREKEERMSSVMAGREGREFCAKAALKQKKSGGLTNREKQRRKKVPLGVHRQQMKVRASSKRGGKGGSKGFKGKKAWKS